MKKSVVIISLAVLLLVPMASAGFFDFLTGSATEGNTNLTINIANTAPKILNISLTGLTINPTEATTTSAEFSVIVDDRDGEADIDNFSMVANLSRTGEDLRELTTSNGICTVVGILNATVKNFTCPIDMYWYDEAAVWTIDVSVNDSSGADNITNQETFTFASLTAFVVGPAVITFAEITAGATNQESDNDPTVLNNTGNFDVTEGNILINATNLTGETDSSKVIQANLFRVGNATGSAIECGAEAMNGSSFKSIGNLTLLRGNFTIDDGSTGQDEAFYCLTSAISSLTKQAYSTLAEGPWTIKIQ